ncbi:MAG: tetratricopeptide repeat protein [Pseudomonadota bacterium]
MFPSRILACSSGLILSLLAGLASANGWSGNYLSARHAGNMDDYAAAANYYNRTLSFDTENVQLQEDAVLAFVMSGDFEAALDWVSPTQFRAGLPQMSRLVTLSDTIRSGFWRDAEDYLIQDEDQMSPIMTSLLRGWVLFGAGDLEQALVEFDGLGEAGLGVLGQYHSALAIAASGDLPLAIKIMDGGDQNPIHLDRTSIEAHARMLAQSGNPERAIEIIERVDPTGSDLRLAALQRDLVDGKQVEFDLVQTAQDGTAEVFRTLAAFLSSEDNTDASLIYARFSEFLKPGQADIQLMIGEILRQTQTYDLASKALAAVAADDPLFPLAEMTRAEVLADSGQIDVSITVLEVLGRQRPELADIPIAMGDILRMEERFAEAEGFYTSALEKLSDDTNDVWRIHYARGISRERTDQWDLAETDFRKALDLQPNQPFVQNYLGYSLVEQKRNLDEALEMIRSAVEQLPQDGYITDSLGWALYRLGRYDEAVEPMERAAELVATDPIINDHLGDVYWMVGRQREARFQWRRALSFEPEEQEVPKIKRKLEIGLNAFLDEQSSQETALTE